jgi:AcrR family transcriptional regulator
MKFKSKAKSESKTARRRAPRTAPVLAPVLKSQRALSRHVKPDSRSAKTVEQILLATIALMLRHGSAELSMRAICDEAGVSRGTLYRYFSSKEEVLHGVTLHLRSQTDRGVKEATDPYNDPQRRFEGFVRYMFNNDETTEASYLLEAEPVFTIKYLKANFKHFMMRVNEALGPVFDAWDRELGAELDRNLLVEMFIRYALSEMLIPSGPSRHSLSRRITAMLNLWRSPAGARPRARTKMEAPVEA